MSGAPTSPISPLSLPNGFNGNRLQCSTQHFPGSTYEVLLFPSGSQVLMQQFQTLLLNYKYPKGFMTHPRVYLRLHKLPTVNDEQHWDSYCLGQEWPETQSWPLKGRGHDHVAVPLFLFAFLKFTFISHTCVWPARISVHVSAWWLQRTEGKPPPPTEVANSVRGWMDAANQISVLCNKSCSSALSHLSSPQFHCLLSASICLTVPKQI